VEEIRQAITELPVEELEKYLSETIWEGVQEGSPEDDELHRIRDEAIEPFITGYTNLETRDGYNKLMELAGIEGQKEKMSRGRQPLSSHISS